MAQTRLQNLGAGAGPLCDRVPPAAFFVTSAASHYFGPSLAVLLFAHVSALGVMWLRVATAALVFAVWRRPWQILRVMDRRQIAELVALGALLAAMNSVFYLAVARLPLATVGAIEFLGTVMLATLGVRNVRNLVALLATTGGVALLTVIKATSSPSGLIFAFANCAAFMAYVILGHRIANSDVRRPDAGRGGNTGGIDQLAAAMLIATLIATPIGGAAAGPAFRHPVWLLWGLGVGISSSVIPYVTDQLAMARMPRATFALMLALLPACATVIGIAVLDQIPTIAEASGIGLVICGLLLHSPPTTAGGDAKTS